MSLTVCPRYISRRLAGMWAELVASVHDTCEQLAFCSLGPNTVDMFSLYVGSASPNSAPTMLDPDEAVAAAEAILHEHSLSQGHRRA